MGVATKTVTLRRRSQLQKSAAKKTTTAIAKSRHQQRRPRRRIKVETKTKRAEPATHTSWRHTTDVVKNVRRQKHRNQERMKNRLGVTKKMKTKGHQGKMRIAQRRERV